MLWITPTDITKSVAQVPHTLRAAVFQPTRHPGYGRQTLLIIRIQIMKKCVAKLQKQQQAYPSDNPLLLSCDVSGQVRLCKHGNAIYEAG